MKTPHILNRTNRNIQYLEIALKNGLFPKNLAVLLKHHKKHFLKDNTCKYEHTRDSLANVVEKVITHLIGGQIIFIN